MRLFYPLRDPISDLHKVSVENKGVDLHVYIADRFCGSLRMTYAQEIGLVNLMIGRTACAEEDDSGRVSWKFDYDKRIVVADDGSFVETKELQQ